MDRPYIGTLELKKEDDELALARARVSILTTQSQTVVAQGSNKLINPQGRYSPNDPAMGAADRAIICASCGQNSDQCLGHKGIIDKITPTVDYPDIEKLLKNLVGFCVNCRELNVGPYRSWLKTIENKHVRRFITQYIAGQFHWCGEAWQIHPFPGQRKVRVSASITGGNAVTVIIPELLPGGKLQTINYDDEKDRPQQHQQNAVKKQRNGYKKPTNKKKHAFYGDDESEHDKESDTDKEGDTDHDGDGGDTDVDDEEEEEEEEEEEDDSGINSIETEGEKSDDDNADTDNESVGEKEHTDDDDEDNTDKEEEEEEEENKRKPKRKTQTKLEKQKKVKKAITNVSSSRKKLTKTEQQEIVSVEEKRSYETDKMKFFRPGANGRRLCGKLDIAHGCCGLPTPTFFRDAHLISVEYHLEFNGDPMALHRLPKWNPFELYDFLRWISPEDHFLLGYDTTKFHLRSYCRRYETVIQPRMRLNTMDASKNYKSDQSQDGQIRKLISQRNRIWTHICKELGVVPSDDQLLKNGFFSFDNMYDERLKNIFPNIGRHVIWIKRAKPGVKCTCKTRSRHTRCRCIALGEPVHCQCEASFTPFHATPVPCKCVMSHIHIDDQARLSANRRRTKTEKRKKTDLDFLSKSPTTSASTSDFTNSSFSQSLSSFGFSSSSSSSSTQSSGSSTQSSGSSTHSGSSSTQSMDNTENILLSSLEKQKKDREDMPPPQKRPSKRPRLQKTKPSTNNSERDDDEDDDEESNKVDGNELDDADDRDDEENDDDYDDDDNSNTNNNNTDCENDTETETDIDTETDAESDDKKKQSVDEEKKEKKKGRKKATAAKKEPMSIVSRYRQMCELMIKSKCHELKRKNTYDAVPGSGIMLVDSKQHGKTSSKWHKDTQQNNGRNKKLSAVGSMSGKEGSAAISITKRSNCNAQYPVAPCISTNMDELMIPEEIFNTITYSRVMYDHNRAESIDRIRSGQVKLLKASKDSMTSYSTDYININTIAPGANTVLECIMDEYSYGVLNRFPTLHLACFQGVRLIKIPAHKKIDAFLVNLLLTMIMGMDFDGDLSQVRAALNAMIAAEIMCIVEMSRQMGSQHGTGSISGLLQNAMVALALVSIGHCKIPKDLFCDLLEYFNHSNPRMSRLIKTRVPQKRVPCNNNNDNNTMVGEMIDDFDFPDEKMFSGRQLIQQLCPPGFFYAHNVHADKEMKKFHIINGIVVGNGHTGKTEANLGSNSFTFVVLQDYGADMVREWLSGMQRVMNHFITATGLSIHYEDIVPPVSYSSNFSLFNNNISNTSVNNNNNSNTNNNNNNSNTSSSNNNNSNNDNNIPTKWNYKDKWNAIRRDLERTLLHPQLAKRTSVVPTKKQAFFMEIMDKAKQMGRELYNRELNKQLRLTPGSGINIVDSGSKGSREHLFMMGICVGIQQHTGSGIFPRGEFYQNTAYKPEAHGYLTESFEEGLSDIGTLYISSRARHEALVAVQKIPDTGTKSKNLSNYMAEQCVENDGSVRESDKRVIQYYYGDDQISPSAVERLPNQSDASLWFETPRELAPPDLITLTDEVYKIYSCMADSLPLELSPRTFPFNPSRLIARFEKNPFVKIDASSHQLQIKREPLAKAYDKKLDDELLLPWLNNYGYKCFGDNRYFLFHRATLRDMINPWRLRHIPSREKINELLIKVYKKIYKSRMAPYTAVGVVAAQSMCQPLIQNNLKSGHNIAGQIHRGSSESVDPRSFLFPSPNRLNAVINVSDMKKKSMMLVALKEPWSSSSVLANACGLRLQSRLLKEITKDVTYFPYIEDAPDSNMIISDLLLHVDCYKQFANDGRLTNPLVKMTFHRELCHALDITMLEVATLMIIHWGNQASVIHDETSCTVYVYLYLKPEKEVPIIATPTNLNSIAPQNNVDLAPSFSLSSSSSSSGLATTTTAAAATTTTTFSTTNTNKRSSKNRRNNTSNGIVMNADSFDVTKQISVIEKKLNKEKKSKTKQDRHRKAVEEASVSMAQRITSYRFDLCDSDYDSDSDSKHRHHYATNNNNNNIEDNNEKENVTNNTSTTTTNDDKNNNKNNDTDNNKKNNKKENKNTNEIHLPFEQAKRNKKNTSTNIMTNIAISKIKNVMDRSIKIPKKGTFCLRQILKKNTGENLVQIIRTDKINSVTLARLFLSREICRNHGLTPANIKSLVNRLFKPHLIPSGTALVMPATGAKDWTIDILLRTETQETLLYNVKSSVERLLCKTQIRGLANVLFFVPQQIHRCVYIPGTGIQRTREWALRTTGSNYSNLMLFPFVDFERSSTSFVHDVNELMGIEASRICQFETLDIASREGGTDQDLRPLSLIADETTAYPHMNNKQKITAPTAMSEKGLRTTREEAIIRRSLFREPAKVFLDATKDRIKDNLNSFRAAIFMGRPLPMGTGLVHLVPAVCPVEKRVKISKHVWDKLNLFNLSSINNDNNYKAKTPMSIEVMPDKIDNKQNAITNNTNKTERKPNAVATTTTSKHAWTLSATNPTVRHIAGVEHTAVSLWSYSKTDKKDICWSRSDDTSGIVWVPSHSFPHTHSKQSTNNNTSKHNNSNNSSSNHNTGNNNNTSKHNNSNNGSSNNNNNKKQDPVVIIETSFNDVESQWKFERVRHDKHHANEWTTVVSTFTESILQPINIQDICPDHLCRDQLPAYIQPSLCSLEVTPSSELRSQWKSQLELFR